MYVPRTLGLICAGKVSPSNSNLFYANTKHSNVTNSERYTKELTEHVRMIEIYRITNVLASIHRENYFQDVC